MTRKRSGRMNGVLFRTGQGSRVDGVEDGVDGVQNGGDEGEDARSSEEQHKVVGGGFENGAAHQTAEAFGNPEVNRLEEDHGSADHLDT